MRTEEEIELEYYIDYITRQKERKLYEVEDVQKELEDLTEDEEEIKQRSPRQFEIWGIKKDIKIAFKKDLVAPKPCLEYYKMGRVIGRGSYGKVNLALHKLTRKVVAVKSINKSLFSDHEECKKRVGLEIQIFSRLRHKNIVKLFEKIETERHVLLFMELCQGGDLLTYVRKRKKLDENTCKYFFRQILIGVGYLHTKKIVHKDLKLENILIDNEGIIKLTDFGLSKKLVSG